MGFRAPASRNLESGLPVLAAHSRDGNTHQRSSIQATDDLILAETFTIPAGFCSIGLENPIPQALTRGHLQEHQGSILLVIMMISTATLKILQTGFGGFKEFTDTMQIDRDHS